MACWVVNVYKSLTWGLDFYVHPKGGRNLWLYHCNVANLVFTAMWMCLCNGKTGICNSKMIQFMPANNSNSVITILIHSAKTHFQDIFFILLRRVEKDLTSLIWRHKCYDFNVVSFWHLSYWKCVLRTSGIRMDNIFTMIPYHHIDSEFNKSGSPAGHQVRILWGPPEIYTLPVRMSDTIFSNNK